VLCLISGGGSALLPLPDEGITLEEKQATTRLLLASGATIHEINAVRKHIDQVKGGRFARLCADKGATIVSLILLFAWIAHSLGAPELLGGFAAGLALSRQFFFPFAVSLNTSKVSFMDTTISYKPDIYKITSYYRRCLDNIQLIPD
jgi:hypothetical protein